MEVTFLGKTAIICADDGGVEIPHIGLRIPGEVFAMLGLFDESREGFEDYETDSRIASYIVSMKLEMMGYAEWPNPSDGCMSLETAVKLICSPGPGYDKPPHVCIFKP